MEGLNYFKIKCFRGKCDDGMVFLKAAQKKLKTNLKTEK